MVGHLLHRESRAGIVVGGLAAHIALAAAAHGGSVQFVGKVGDDEAGDAVVLALAGGGVGHAALLREAGRPTPRVASIGVDSIEAADVDLALRYLTDYAVLVLADSATSDVVRVISAAAGWADARLIVVVPAGEAAPEGLPPDGIVFEAPRADPDGLFATMVASFVAALDIGGVPADAFRSSLALNGWTPAPTV